MIRRGYGAARQPKNTKPKKYADGGSVPAPAPAPSPTLAQRLRRMVGMETQAEQAKARKTRMDMEEQKALGK